ncbi:MAG: GNAT family N-acetyltransferase [Planctomycetota bacterium]|jgi:GNAT superfamily N-acetyltransferase
MIPAIRSAQVRDVNYLADIDLKSYDYPWPIDKWRRLAIDPTCVILLASFTVEPIGFCVWEKKPETKEATILRLATKPIYRSMGVASLLLEASECGAKENELQTMTFIIPEIKCFPGQPDDVSQWLLNRGYRAGPPILKDYFYMYGADCDGFIFTHSLTEKTDA